MFRKILTNIGWLFCLGILMTIPPAFASGILHVKVGEEVIINEVSKNTGELKWIIKQDGEIIETKTGRNLTYVFNTEGQYEVILNLANQEQVLDSVLKVFAGSDYIMPAMPVIMEGEETDAFQAILETLPPADATGKINLKGDENAVTFLAADSKWEIVEYRIDSNIYYDSDGNGDPADDIDNQNDVSYLTGAPWTTVYQKSWGNIATRLTIVAKNGQKETVDYVIVFSNLPVPAEPLEAKMLTLPRQNTQDQKIYLAGNEAKVVFLSNLSTGKIKEFRLDKNIYFDSNGDGSPANDIDNFNDASLYTGANFEANYSKDWGKTVAQLTVVSIDGKGSLVQREIVFDNSKAEKSTIQAILWADKTEVFSGDTINFQVKNAVAGETYKWDFNGDSVIDLETQNLTATHFYEKTGEYLVTLLVANAEEAKTQSHQKIIVKNSENADKTQNTKWPLVEFEYLINGGKVQFQNQSAIDPNLENQEYRSEWDFGDGTSGMENSPEHLYPEIATYDITLKVTDSLGRTASKIAQVSVTNLEISADSIAGTGAETVKTTSGSVIIPNNWKAESKQEGNFFWWILVILLYLIGGLLALALVGVGGYLIYLKIKFPDFTFAELIEEEKNKFFGGATNVKNETLLESKTENKNESVVVNQPKQTTASAPTQASKSQTVIDVEAEEEKSVPAWLQQAQQKVNKPTTEAPKFEPQAEVKTETTSQQETQPEIAPVPETAPTIPVQIEPEDNSDELEIGSILDESEEPQMDVFDLTLDETEAVPVVEEAVIPLVEEVAPPVQTDLPSAPDVTFADFKNEVTNTKKEEPKIWTKNLNEPVLLNSEKTDQADKKTAETISEKITVETAQTVQPISVKKTEVPLNLKNDKKVFTQNKKPENRTKNLNKATLANPKKTEQKDEKSVEKIAEKKVEKTKLEEVKKNQPASAQKAEVPLLLQNDQKVPKEKTSMKTDSKSAEFQDIPQEKKAKSAFQEIPLEEKKTDQKTNPAKDDIPDWLK